MFGGSKQLGYQVLRQAPAVPPMVVYRSAFMKQEMPLGRKAPRFGASRRGRSERELAQASGRVPETRD